MPGRNRGETVALRGVRPFGRHGETVTFAVAGTVIIDASDLVVVATVAGSDLRSRAGRGSGPRERLVLPDDWFGSYTTGTWLGPGVVRVHRWGEPWSVWRWHDGSSWSDGWYGNLETPWQRTPLGYDSQDWTLDVVARGIPGTASWQVGYKDEDELAFLVDEGLTTPTEAERAAEAGERLTAIAVDGSWPFDADWDQWLPDPGWGPARLPPGWDQPVRLE